MGSPRRSVPAGAWRFAVWTTIATSTAASTAAQHAALRCFDVADGLPTPRITSILEEERGFLWVTTPEGVARFDGRSFQVFGARDGLRRVTPNEAAIDRDGTLWLALNGDGVARLSTREPGSSPAAFEILTVGEGRAVNTVNALRFDADGTLWLGTEAGLARASAPRRVEDSRAPHAAPEFELLADSVACLRPQGACTTADGASWFVGARGLACVRDGRVTTSALPVSSAHPEYLVIADDRDGGVLVGDDRSLWRFTPADGGAGKWTPIPLELASNQGVRALARDSHADLWVGTTSGLLRLRGDDVAGFTTAEGLPDNSIRCLHEDRGGRLWAGTWFGGVVQLGRGDVVSWTRSEAMPNPDSIEILGASDGSVIASTTNDGLFRFDDHGAERLGAGLSPRFDRVWTRLIELPSIGFVVGTDEGLFLVDGPRFDLARARPLTVDGDGGGELRDFRPIALGPGRGAGEFLVAEFDGRIVRVSVARDGRASAEAMFDLEHRAALLGELRDSVRRLASAPDGTVWAASRQGLVRVRDGRWEAVEARDGLPTTEVRALEFDAHGRLWIGLRYDGLSVCDDPAAERLAWRSIPGLREEGVFALAAARDDGLYVGTGSGVLELDARGEVTRRFDRASGLASDAVNEIALDTRGRVLVATPAGVTRIDAAGGEAAAAAPATWITRVEIDGEALAIPQRAARELGPLELERGAGMLLVEFSAPWLGEEEPLSFQLRLDGRSAPWSTPQDEPRVRFANLAPGDYELEVRAVVGTAERAAERAGEPARLAFRVPPPFWRSPWFLGASLCALGSVAFAWHRLRLRQALALERLRSQIALDLHDELGADLTQVAILAELAKRDTLTHAPGDASARAGEGDSLTRVAELAREMRTSLADIVWSVDPRRDRVGDLAVRLREVGSQLVESAGIEFAFRVEADRDVAALPLAPDERRGLYLIVKESLHNAVKHARAGRVDVVLRIDRGRLSLSVRDDGRGFDPAAESTGHGLRSLASRAQALGARLRVQARPGEGTAILVELAPRARPA